MSTATLPVVAATAADVRHYFRTNAEAFAALSGDAQHTVELGARGRLHPEATEAFNATVSKARAYVEKAQKVSPLEYRHGQPSGRTVKRVAMLTNAEQRRLAVAGGAVVGARGPLSPKALEAAGAQYEVERQARLAAAE